MKVMTLTMLGKVRIVMFGNKGWVGTATISRSGSVSTSLHRSGRPQRQKNWTAKRDHRKRMERLERRASVR
jgi:hypothetical protein